MESLEQIKARVESAVTGAKLEIIANGASENPASLLVSAESALVVVQFLKSDPQLQLDFLSNVTGVDYPDKKIQDKVRVKRKIDGREIEMDEVVETLKPGFLEVVYHFYSMALKQGPVILRMRTGNRSDSVKLPSLTPLYHSADFQEREIFDLYGVVFEGHPDLRRLLMWDEFEGHPMRKDYKEPDDYEYEPTPHGSVLEKARARQAVEVPRG